MSETQGQTELKMFNGKDVVLRHGEGELDDAMKAWAMRVGAVALLAVDTESKRTKVVWSNPNKQAA